MTSVNPQRQPVGNLLTHHLLGLYLLGPCSPPTSHLTGFCCLLLAIDAQGRGGATS